MTVEELACNINVSPEKLFYFYEYIQTPIPHELDFELSEDLIKSAIDSKLLFDKKKSNITKVNIEKVIQEIEDSESQTKHKIVGKIPIDFFKSRLEKRKTNEVKIKSSPSESIIKNDEVVDNLEPFFKKRYAVLLKEFKEYNSIPNFIFEGDFRKIEGKSFGFFKNITHQNGTELKYPVSNDSVVEIFIPTSELVNGNRYSFEAKIARLHEREKSSNPFLLQAKGNNIKEIIELGTINQELKIKQKKLEEINSYLENAEIHFEKKKSEVEKKISKELQEKRAEANSIIEEHLETINQKFNEIQTKEKKLTSLNELVGETNNHLQKMENLLNTLKDRVSLCRNLQFISEDEENNYLNLLSAKEFKPINHLDFEKDFEKSFSELSEHIHAYLYHKKNLIYTEYQIKNFLTLLRTHDLIVLSGLSGSGKTRIVKAFAEALGGVAKIIPVKPNWTSSDDLVGYYNPLQMSFLPTPFTEAIVEAISNPNQLYFICLDEMNLARAEYYFADFLSKLEERNQQPEIELYANHEEELFVSEFTTLLNLIESSIQGEKIKSWQEFLDNEEARNKFYEMLGNSDKESMLQLHAKMKRRLIDILKFPSKMIIPDNVRFIGAINVDETTHYFSPKILDRIHVVKFENPLLYEDQVNDWFENRTHEKELKPVYVNPNFFPKRIEYPSLRREELSIIENELKYINQKFLIPMKIDFGIRSIRQALNYYDIERLDVKRIFTYYNDDSSSWEEEPFRIEYPVSLQVLNTIIIQKILPRLIFDGNDTAIAEKTKEDIVKEFCDYLKENLKNYMTYDSDGAPNDNEGVEIEVNAYSILNEMIKNAENNSQYNFFA